MRRIVPGSGSASGRRGPSRPGQNLEPAPASTPKTLRPGTQRSRLWPVLVPIVCLLAGFGFATSASDADGTDLRAPVSVDLADVVHSAQDRVRKQDLVLQRLQAQINVAAKAAGADDASVRNAQNTVAPLQSAGGLTAVSGAGLTLVLNDSHESIQGVDPNQLVVHQSDMQAAVNALWAGGAEAMSIAGQRLIATSAVRCVGNTLLLNGEVFSPPFRIVAIGPFTQMQNALAASPGVRTFLQAAEYYGLGYTLTPQPDLMVPAYDVPVSLSYAKPVGR